jgi:hypothetical protein
VNDFGPLAHAHGVLLWYAWRGPRAGQLVSCTKAKVGHKPLSRVHKWPRPRSKNPLPRVQALPLGTPSRPPSGCPDPRSQRQYQKGPLRSEQSEPTSGPDCLQRRGAFLHSQNNFILAIIYHHCCVVKPQHTSLWWRQNCDVLVLLPPTLQVSSKNLLSYGGQSNDRSPPLPNPAPWSQSQVQKHLCALLVLNQYSISFPNL